MVTPRRDRLDVDIDAVDAPVGKHMQLRDETAPHQTNPDFRHCGCLRVAAGDDPLFTANRAPCAAPDTAATGMHRDRERLATEALK
jgi:hypothetical protein